MKDIVTKINEASEEWVILNKSGINGNKKYEKLAKQGGVKYKGEYWFVSVGSSTEEDAKEAYKGILAEYQGSGMEKDFTMCKISDLEENHSRYR